jgi:hypothetical protein
MPRALKFALSSLLIGAMSIGIAYAGATLVPVDLSKDAAPEARQAAIAQAAMSQQADAGAPVTLQPRQVLAGSAKASMEPRPQDWGGTWETDREKCATFEPSESGFSGTATHVTGGNTRVKWAENPNCIYMGGYGIGPMNPITSWSDPYGLWVRSVAIGDGDDTVIMTVLDGVYWEARYNSMCGPNPCGWYDIIDELSADLDIDRSGFFLAATHSHTSPDFIGGWGGVPQWYMDQITAAIKATIRAAVDEMRPALVETSEVLARPYNGERRDFYRSAEEEGLTWFRLLEHGAPAADSPITYNADGTWAHGPGGGTQNGGANGCENNTANENCLQAIATVGAFAAHPVTADEGSGIANADFPAVFDTRVEQMFGGVGLFFQTGLGNVSPRGGTVSMGEGLASLLPEIGVGRILENNCNTDGNDETPPVPCPLDISSSDSRWVQPATNVPLSTLGAAGFFDRKFNEVPAAVQAGKSNTKNCKSSSPLSVETGVNAARIGQLLITGGPGELFSALSNTIKERNPNGVTMPLGLVNDGLGYIVQSFETDHVGRQGAGFLPGVGAPVPVEYEDAYSIDACFGDMVLERTLGLPQVGGGGVATTTP